MITRQHGLLTRLLLPVCLLCAALVQTAASQTQRSVYLAANHHTAQFDAWNLQASGTVNPVGTYSLQYATDPAGIGIDALNPDSTEVMFISSEFSLGLEILNPKTLEYMGVSSGPSNLAGVDVDDVDDIVFSLLRQSNTLYIFHWDYVSQTLTELDSVSLPGMSWGFGIALDDSRDILWVTDTPNRKVRAYDVNVSAWTDIVEVPSLSFDVSHQPVDITVDPVRNIVYTVAGWLGSSLLTKYDVASETETTHDLTVGATGIAVDPILGYVYMTRGPEAYDNYAHGDDLQVWDCSTSPFSLIQDTGPIGNPAGIAIGAGYNPPDLAKNDVVQGHGVSIGQKFTYEITFANNDNVIDMTNTAIVDQMPPELDFVSEEVDGVAGTGSYDALAHSITWNIGTVPAGLDGPMIELEVRVNDNAEYGTTIYNYCTIVCDQFDSITVIGEDPDDPDPGPGTDIVPPDITPTNEWINVFCGQPTLNGVPLEPGDIIRAYDPDSVLCGMDSVRANGAYGFMPIYAEEPFNSGDQGAEPGDVIRFTVNGEEVFTDPVITWTANGDAFELCEFYTCQFCTLDSGWNLVSWNREYAATIEDFMAMLGDDSLCIELVLGFDQGAMTYDPKLPEFSTLPGVDYHFGYWFLLSCPIELEVCTNKIPADDYIQIYSGWNLIGYWPDEVLPVETALATIYDDLMVALGYDGGGLTHIPGEEPFNTLTEMGPCFGYWAKMSDDGTLWYPGWTGPPPARLAPIATRSSNVVPSPTWVSLYGSGITVDGVPVAENSVIEAYTSDGVLCGRGRYVEGMLKFTPIYGYEPTGRITAGYPGTGDEISLRVNGTEVTPILTWTENGDRIRVSRLQSGEGGSQLPGEYRLSQNYPNPFNPATDISFSIPTLGHVELTVFNILGQEVNRLVDADLAAGDYSVIWHGDDGSGSQVSSGLYLYRLSSGEVTLTKKMILTK